MRDPIDDTTHSDTRIGRLKKRADFLRVGKGRRWHGKGFSLQAGGSDSDLSPRVGFTVTKKVGCAVVRNRARRRLREALRLIEGLPADPRHDYVIVARQDALRLPFKALQSDLLRAVRGIHAKARPQDASSQDASKRPNRTRPRP